MITPSIENRIPDDLKQAKIWTFTRTDFDEKSGKDLKVPMDPVLLDLGSYAGISTIDHLLTFEMLKKVRNVPDNWLPAFRLDAINTGWVMIDVEPGGMTPDNPYFMIKYSYTEASRHDGFHGLIKLNTTYSFMNKTAVKMHKYDTEVLLNNHFVTLTGKTPSDLYKPTVNDLNMVSQGIQQFADQLAEIDDENLIEASLADMSLPLSNDAQTLFDTLNIKQMTRPSGVDTSEWEFTNLVKKYNGLYKTHYPLIKDLSNEDRIAVLYRAAQTALPHRKKHERMFNDSQHGDRVNYLFYIVRRIVETN